MMRPPSLSTAPPIKSHARRDFKADPVGCLLRCSRELGQTVKLELDRPTYLLNSVEDIRHILTVNPLNYLKAGFEVELVGVFGRSLINFEGDPHRTARKELAPHFQQRALSAWPACVTAHVRAMTANWPDGGQIDLAKQVMHAMVGVSAQMMLGLGLDQSSSVDELFWLIHKVHEATIQRRRTLSRWLAWMPTRANRRYARFTGELDRFMRRLMDERRQGPLDGDDFLSLMLRWQKEHPDSRTDIQVRDQATGLFLAAYEPAANAIIWSLANLADHPDIESKVIQQISQTLGPRTPTLADLESLRGVRMVFDETLRLNPSPWLLTRMTVERDTLPTGLTLQPGDRLFISPYTLHRRADLYPDPERFDPERFTPERCKARHPYAYIPFGGGPRICIGEHMGRLSAIVALTAILPAWQVTPNQPRPPLESVNGFTMQPRDGVLMAHVLPRSGQP
ncbi:MAG: cytochrome P450 [Phycisphaera sp.]|nr:cytochrome P450 [Phycisphaera sp.]